MADDLLIDLLFAANGQTYESLKDHVRMVTVQDVRVRTLDIEGLLLTKTSYASLGHYIATVIKVNHDHERVQLEPLP